MDFDIYHFVGNFDVEDFANILRHIANADQRHRDNRAQNNRHRMGQNVAPTPLPARDENTLNVFLNPTGLINGNTDFKKVFTNPIGSSSAPKKCLPIVYKYGEEPFTALAASRGLFDRSQQKAQPLQPKTRSTKEKKMIKKRTSLRLALQRSRARLRSSQKSFSSREEQGRSHVSETKKKQNPLKSKKTVTRSGHKSFPKTENNVCIPSTRVLRSHKKDFVNNVK